MVPLPNRKVTITVNPAEGFLFQVHFRDHLGSSAISKAFSPDFDSSEAGQPMVLDLAGISNYLCHRPIEWHPYDPFNRCFGTAAFNGPW